MPIFTPDHFRGADGATARLLMEQHPFATLVTSVAAGEPHITYVPLLLEGDVLRGHIARANPHWQHFAGGSTVAIFHGPHAYVSPFWYREPVDNVPTWNYAVVHAYGRPAVEEGTDTLAQLGRLFARFDGGRPLPTDAAKARRMVGGIVSFRMPVERIEAKYKMSQNKTAADRAGVVAGLRATGRAEDRAVADWMQAHERN